MVKEPKPIGRVSHFFDNINVAVIKLDKGLKVGDKIKITGGTTDFKQPVKSMQVEHESIKSAKKGDEVGMKVKEKVRINDKVYLVK
jgi:translation elongation factor EF-1alpha